MWRSSVEWESSPTDIAVPIDWTYLSLIFSSSKVYLLNEANVVIVSFPLVHIVSCPFVKQGKAILKIYRPSFLISLITLPELI